MVKINRTYASELVTMVWDGIPFEAFADTFVTIEYMEEHVTATQGPDKVVSHSINANTMGTIEVTLQQNSDTHKLLSAILLDQKENADLKLGKFLVVDPSGATLYDGNNTCIMGSPTLTLGKTHEDGLKTWKFHAAELKILA